MFTECTSLFRPLIPPCCAVLFFLQALPLLLACLHDLRDPADLTLRQAAAAALEKFITAAAAVAASAGVTTPGLGGSIRSSSGDGSSEGQLLSHLVTRVLYPQLKSQLSAPSLAVRQEHLALLRALVIAFPAKWVVADTSSASHGGSGS